MPSDGVVPFGRSIIGVTPAEALALETEACKHTRFVAMDNALATAIEKAFSGDPLVALSRRDQEWAVSLNVTGPELAGIPDWFDLAAQEKRGGWYIPGEVSLKIGLVNLPALFNESPRFATGLALDQRARVATSRSPTGIYVWAVLEPLFETLMRPILLRGPELGQKTRQERLAAWAAIDSFCRSLDLQVAGELENLGFASGWSKRTSAQQLSAKLDYLEALRRQVTGATGRRWRQLAIQTLSVAYYAKANHQSRTQREILTTGLQKVMVGWFLGDWLAYLDYLGEQPAPSEEIIKALPTPRLYVTIEGRAPAVAARTGIPEAEVQRILASFVGQGTLQSSVERRIAVLRRYWTAFGKLHDRQSPGRASLQGLVENGSSSVDPPGYLMVLSGALLAEIDECWGGVCIPPYADRIVSATHPHKGMADTFGAALAFWHGVSVTAWVVCESLVPLENLSRLEERYSPQLAELGAAACPVPPGLFAELAAAQSRLATAEPLWEPANPVAEPNSPITLSMSMPRRGRREGFQSLRDIISQHRSRWTEICLEAYLRYRWESPLREFADQCNRAFTTSGRAPSKGRLVTLGAPVSNHWFGGDLGMVASAVGLKGLSHPTRVKLIPDKRFGFVRRVFEQLGGQSEPPDYTWDQLEERRRNLELSRLAGDALRYLQYEECVGRPPTAKEFRAERYTWPEGIEEGWAGYQAAVENARTVSGSSDPSSLESPGAGPTSVTGS